MVWGSLCCTSEACWCGARPEEILFTSGGSESNNTVIKGIAVASREHGRHIITSSVEHPAVIEPCRALEAEGYEVTSQPVDANGRVYHESYAMDPGVRDKGACRNDDSCPGGYRCTDGRCAPGGADVLFAEATLLGGTEGGGRTFYARFGDVFGWACTLATLGIWAVWPRLRRRRERKRATS